MIVTLLNRHRDDILMQTLHGHRCKSMFAIQLSSHAGYRGTVPSRQTQQTLTRFVQSVE